MQVIDSKKAFRPARILGVWAMLMRFYTPPPLTERKCTAPAGLQAAINSLVHATKSGRSFVRCVLGSLSWSESHPLVDFESQETPCTALTHSPRVFSHVVLQPVRHGRRCPCVRRSNDPGESRNAPATACTKSTKVFMFSFPDSPSFIRRRPTS
jgi:hypothetical protein